MFACQKFKRLLIIAHCVAKVWGEQVTGHLLQATSSGMLERNITTWLNVREVTLIRLVSKNYSTFKKKITAFYLCLQFSLVHVILPQICDQNLAEAHNPGC